MNKQQPEWLNKLIAELEERQDDEVILLREEDIIHELNIEPDEWDAVTKVEKNKTMRELVF